MHEIEQPKGDVREFTSPTPFSCRYVPDIELLMALCILVLVCLWQNRNAESKKKLYACDPSM